MLTEYFSARNSVSRKSLYLVILALVLLALPSQAATSERKSSRRWHIAISGLGGQWAGAPFLKNYMMDGNHNMWLWTSGDDGESDAWSEGRSQLLAGCAIGLSYDFSPVITAYAEYAFLPELKFGDGKELEYQRYWDEGLQTYVSQTLERTQTGRKAKIGGAALGVLLRPFGKIPLKLDIKAGWWSYKGEFISPTCAFYDGIANYSFLEKRSEGRQAGSYEGQGQWIDQHTTLLLGIGLKYFPWRWVSIDFGYQGLSYIQIEYTGYLYQETGEHYDAPVYYGLGSMWKTGLTLYF